MRDAWLTWFSDFLQAACTILFGIFLFDIPPISPLFGFTRFTSLKHFGRESMLSFWHPSPRLRTSDLSRTTRSQRPGINMIVPFYFGGLLTRGHCSSTITFPRSISLLPRVLPHFIRKSSEISLSRNSLAYCLIRRHSHFSCNIPTMFVCDPLASCSLLLSLIFRPSLPFITSAV